MIPLISLHYFLSFFIVVVVYKIGYGYDPFVHEASMKLIEKNGSIDPKPLYYLGQYSLILTIHKITFVSISFLNKALVPFCGAFFLPPFLYKNLNEYFENKKAFILSIFALLSVPFSFFIITTPQNLGYFFLLVVLMLGFSAKTFFDFFIIFLISTAALLTHPVAGLPAMLFSVAIMVYRGNLYSLKKYFYFLIFLISSVSLPAAFYLLEKGMNADEQRGAIAPVFVWPKFIVPSEENFLLNFLYLYGFNIKIIFAATVIVGILLAWKRRQKYKIFFVYLLLSASLLFSYLLARQLSFDFLIEYEKNGYADRLLFLSALFLSPFAVIFFYYFTTKALKASLFIRIALTFFLCASVAVSLYFSYPRLDNYFNSRGYSIGVHDIDAVRWIEDDSREDFIVLADQQVSAAALNEFEFKKYYKTSSGDIFYYPIPTGGLLYQYFLDMVYKKPDRETVVRAMDMVGVNEAYFVLNKYWWAFPRLLEEAKIDADSWKEFGQNDVFVFKYKRNASD